MRAILGQRPLRFVFAANVISMLGSGMNSAAVAWYILQATHSEMALGTFAVLQTIPAMLMLPFTGVIIDREDRRRLVMWLDAVRAVIIVTVAILAFRHRVQVWQLYLMNTLVAAGFWMFWPTITALIQELTPEGQFVQSNTFPARRRAGRMAHRRRVRRLHLQPHRPRRRAAARCLDLRGLVPLLLRGAQGTPCGAASRRNARRPSSRGKSTANASGARCATACTSCAIIAQ